MLCKSQITRHKLCTSVTHTSLQHHSQPVWILLSLAPEPVYHEGYTVITVSGGRVKVQSRGLLHPSIPASTVLQKLFIRHMETAHYTGRESYQLWWWGDQSLHLRLAHQETGDTGFTLWDTVAAPHIPYSHAEIPSNKIPDFPLWANSAPGAGATSPERSHPMVQPAQHCEPPLPAMLRDCSYFAWQERD